MHVKWDPKAPGSPGKPQGAYVESAVYDRRTGEKLLRHPVDAREILKRSPELYSESPCAPDPSIIADASAVAEAPSASEIDALRAEIEQLKAQLAAKSAPAAPKRRPGPKPKATANPEP